MGPTDLQDSYEPLQTLRLIFGSNRVLLAAPDPSWQAGAPSSGTPSCPNSPVWTARTVRNPNAVDRTPVNPNVVRHGFPQDRSRGGPRDRVVDGHPARSARLVVAVQV